MTSTIASLFIGSLIVFALCGLALGLGALLGGTPLAGGCSRARGADCLGCPKSDRTGRCRRSGQAGRGGRGNRDGRVGEPPE